MMVDVKKKSIELHGAMPTVASILLIGSENARHQWPISYFHKERFKTIETESFEAAKIALQDEIDLIVLDVSHAEAEGVDFVSKMREAGDSTPVIFVSDKTKEMIVEKAFKCGGDDYLKKPFGTKELICRIKAILKRTQATQCKKIKVRDIVMDFSSRRVFVHQAEVMLTRLEFKLLEIFLKNKNRALERHFLLEQIWFDNVSTQKRTINVTINRLKKKIDPLNNKNYILPIRGIGYKFQ